MLLYSPIDNPLIVSGSGPGLEEALPLIRQRKPGMPVIAASSSLLALNEGGVNADLVISTDGGSWALSLLYSCLRQSKPVQGLAVSLCAALPSQCGAFPLLILNDGCLWQTLVLRELDIPSIIIGQRGTVSASALELALELSRGHVYLSGLDLSVKDIRTHARPHGFDHIFYGSAYRCTPLYSQYYKRAKAAIDGKSLEIYASWFRDRLKRWPKRIFTLDTQNAVFDTAPALSSDDFAGLALDNGGPVTDFLKILELDGNPEQFAARSVNVLCRALEDSPYSQALCTELSELLFPGRKTIMAGDIKKELECLALQYGVKNG